MALREDQVLDLLDDGAFAHLTESAIEKLNTLPTEELVPILKEILYTNSNDYRQTKACDALLHLEGVDRVAFLIELFDGVNSGDIRSIWTGTDEIDLGWGVAACEDLGEFDDQRAVMKLRDILADSPLVDFRRAAAEALANYGDESVINALEWAANHDTERDGLGYLVSDVAADSLQEVRGRVSGTQ